MLFEEKTKIVRRTLNPTYNFSCAIKDIEEIKNVKVKVVIYDYDKNTKVSEIGSAVIALKTLKSALLENTEETEVSLGAKMPAKLDVGSIELGLSYLPTAQRMSFSIIKASQLRFDRCNVTNLGDFGKNLCFLMQFLTLPLAFLAARTASCIIFLASFTLVFCRTFCQSDSGEPFRKSSTEEKDSNSISDKRASLQRDAQL